MHSPDCITLDDNDNDDGHDTDTDTNDDLDVAQLLLNNAARALDAADHQCLQPGQYINDAIVDFWIRHLFTQRHAQAGHSVHCFTSFFWLRLLESGAGDRWTLWTAGVDFSATTTLMIPVCQDLHWTLIVVRLASTVTVMWLDSLGGRISARDIGALAKLLQLIADQCESDSASDYVFVSPPVPRQRNLVDCGLFMLQYIEAVILHPQAVGSYSDRTGRRALFSVPVNRSIIQAVRRKRKEIMNVVSTTESFA